MILYRLRNTKEGRRREEFPVGTLDFREGQVIVEVSDRQLSKQVKALFGETFRVREARGQVDTYLGHAWVDLVPGNERHFDEGLRRLVRLSLSCEGEDG
jgi:hypothetical protein